MNNSHRSLEQNRHVLLQEVHLLVDNSHRSLEQTRHVLQQEVHLLVDNSHRSLEQTRHVFQQSIIGSRLSLLQYIKQVCKQEHPVFHVLQTLSTAITYMCYRL